MIIIYGDLHIGSDRPWNYKVSKDIVSHIIMADTNNENNDLILTGDVTDKNTVDGSVTDLLHELFENLKYRNTYICLGNHEGRIKHNKLSTTYDFVENESYSHKLKSKVRIVKELAEIDIGGINTLFLPHIYFTENSSIKDYAKLPKEVIDKEYDLVIGHVTDSRLDFPSPDKVDISAIKAKQFVMGHIHSGEYGSLGYLGSMIPNSVSENDFPRYEIRIARNLDKVLKASFPLPKFLEYQEVTYPNPLTRTKAKTVVWTFTNCTDEELARTHYKDPDMFIRKCIYTTQIDKEGFKDVVSNASSLQNFQSSLQNWMETKAEGITDSLRNKIQHYSTLI